MSTIQPPSLSDRAVELFSVDWHAFECTGDIQILYNRLFYLSVDLLETRRQLGCYDRLRSELDKYRQRNYRLTQRLAKLQKQLKDANYDVVKSSQARRSSTHSVSCRKIR